MKKLLFLTLAVMLAATMSVVSSAYTKVYIDEKEVEFNESSGYPFIDNGRTLVPLRATMEAFGAEVDWEKDSKTAFVRMGTTTVRCVIGENCIYRNNVRITNDSAAVISGGRTYLPIRVVLESFGAEVGWDGSVKVSSGSAAAFINSVKNSESVTTNYWGIWNDAISQKNDGNYQQAINSILSISKVFLAENQNDSRAILFKHLGECYANLSDFDRASACFREEAAYWEAADMEQSAIDAERRSNLIGTGTQVYVKNHDYDFGARTYFGVMHEPENGVLLGAYAEGDKKLHDPYNPNLFYMDTLPQLVQKDMAAYILYISYGDSISIYETHIQKAREKDKLLQISLQPLGGLHQVTENDPYLIKLAKDIENSDCRMMLRFAGEMNEVTSRWYSEDPQVFVEKFRIVADVFHKYAPSVPVIWAPNYYPDNNYEDYYPGDEYVDYVGVSSYKEHTPVTDPLGMGVDRSRWSNQLDRLYWLYSHKKPIIIAEGNASYSDYNTGADVTDFACSQLKDFYIYLPIKYPNIKMNYAYVVNHLPRKYTLTENAQFLETYKNSIKNDAYLSDVNSASCTYDYYEIGNNVSVKPECTELCSYVTTPYNNVAYVVYTVDGENVGTSYGAPYTVAVDFSKYSGKTVEVNVMSFDEQHKMLTNYTIKVKVQ